MRRAKDETYADVRWDLDWSEANGGKAMSEMLWRCDAIRAGQLYTRMMFDSKHEAERFAERMREAEPDQFFAVEAVEARQVWN